MTSHDLRYLQAGLAELQSYLLSDELFWPVNASSEVGEPPYPKLTPANLLYYRARLAARPHENVAGRAEVEAGLDALITQWRSHWKAKLGREFSSRLRQWLHYVNEVHEKPQTQAPFYATEVRLRALLGLLEAALGKDLPPEASLLAAADSRLRTHFEPGPFVWEAELQAAFPQPAYWFLYGGLKEKDE